MHSPSLETLSQGLAVTVSLVAAITDARTGRIPNWLTGSATVLGIALYATLGGVRSAGVSLLGVLLGVAVPAILYRGSQGRAIGGGDVKLFAALGALLGPTLGLETQFGAFLLLALFAMIQLSYRGQLWSVLMNTVGLLCNPLLPTRRRRNVKPESLTAMRLGPAIAVSVVASVFSEHLVRLVPWLG
jgi:prepilin peptidase CpaA